MTPFLIGNLRDLWHGFTGTSPNTPLPYPLEGSGIKEGWNLDTDNSKLARRWFVGRGWATKTVGVDEASLDYLHNIESHLHKIESHLDKIRFRIGFIALALVLFLIFGLTLTGL